MSSRTPSDAHDVEALETIAVTIAREGAALARRRRAEGVQIAATKSAVADIVTAADREVEALIRQRLSEVRPHDGFLGEETGAEPGSTGVTWVVDPIDGTVNYAYGIPTYATSIAAVAGDPDPLTWTQLAGAVVNPVTGEVFRAALGRGAWLEQDAIPDAAPLRLHVNDEPGPAGALLATGFGYDPATHAGDLARVERIMPMARDIRRAGSAALDLAFVAAGRLDGYFERGIHPWDHAAGGLLVTEAGGVLGGEPGGHPGNTMTIATGPAIFERVLDAVRTR